jgi:hypothetical protein
MEKFADFIRDYSEDHSTSLPSCLETKVAIIDDGVDGLYAGLGRDIIAGETFCTRKDGDYDSYYRSSRGHGTIMATLIRQMCPNVKLYVAKLNEEWTSNETHEPTAESAVQVLTHIHLLLESLFWRNF